MHLKLWRRRRRRRRRRFSSGVTNERQSNVSEFVRHLRCCGSVIQSKFTGTPSLDLFLIIRCLFSCRKVRKGKERGKKIPQVDIARGRKVGVDIFKFFFDKFFSYTWNWTVRKFHASPFLFFFRSLFLNEKNLLPSSFFSFNKLKPPCSRLSFPQTIKVTL